MTTLRGHPPPVEHRWLSARARGKSLASTLAQGPRGEAMRVFAYGSLMWKPCFGYVERAPAVLAGYRRRLSVWTTRARGTPQRPGLGLGLVEEPGECRGLLYTLDPDSRDEDLQALWAREMATGIYRPSWLPVRVDGAEVASLVFVTDPRDPQFAGILSPAEAASYVARARGRYGTCRDYLATTVAELEKIDAPDTELAAVLELVDAEIGS